jgi:flagellar biosynthesis anti-sigma factor FlgM
MRVLGYEGINHLGRVEHAVRENREVPRDMPGKWQLTAEIPVADADKVELSSRARDVHRIQRILSETPEIREVRVAEARYAVQTGTLDLSGQNLADKVLLDLLHNTVLSV